MGLFGTSNDDDDDDDADIMGLHSCLDLTTRKVSPFYPRSTWGWLRTKMSCLDPLPERLLFFELQDFPTSVLKRDYLGMPIFIVFRSVIRLIQTKAP